MPEISNIIDSIQIPQLIKDEHIKNGTPVLDNRGRPEHYSGGFAVVFPFMVNRKKWAFRCWSANIGDLSQRLSTLSTELNKLCISYFCDFVYEYDGIVVDGKVYPTTRMLWIDGVTIKDYICSYKNNPARLLQLAEDFLTMCQALHKHRIAHGDLQHGNILIENSGVIRLIDYDSMYIPALQGEQDIISGIPEYQHPKRKENGMASEKLDYFSELIIYLSIRAIAESPQLVEKFQVEDAERLLFSKEDYLDIERSQIYQDIIVLGKEFEEMLDILSGYLQINDINNLRPFMDIMLENKIVFQASENIVVRKKQKVVIKWFVPFDAEIILTQKDTDFIQQCQRQGEYSTFLDNHATFILTAQTKDGQLLNKRITIKSCDECTISFVADKQYIYPSIPVKLSWNVENAKRVWLDSVMVETSGTKIIEPTKATTCVLSAEDEFGIKEKRIDIRMLPIPQVKSLLVPTPDIANNMSIHICQPRYNVSVNIPPINIDTVNVEVPKVPSFTDMGYDVKLSLPKSSRLKMFKRAYKFIRNKINEKQSKYE